MNGRTFEQPDAAWAAVGEDYSTNLLPLAQLYRKHNINRDALAAAKLRFGWGRRRQRAVSARTIVKRMFRLLDRQIAQLEQEMTTTGEKEAAVLGRLVGTLGKLIEIEGSSGKATKPQTTKEMVDIRNKLIRRIEELKRK